MERAARPGRGACDLRPRTGRRFPQRGDSGGTRPGRVQGSVPRRSSRSMPGGDRSTSPSTSIRAPPPTRPRMTSSCATRWTPRRSRWDGGPATRNWHGGVLLPTRTRRRRGSRAVRSHRRRRAGTATSSVRPRLDDVRASDDPHAAALEFARSAFRHACLVCEWTKPWRRAPKPCLLRSNRGEAATRVRAEALIAARLNPASWRSCRTTFTLTALSRAERGSARRASADLPDQVLGVERENDVAADRAFQRSRSSARSSSSSPSPSSSSLRGRREPLLRRRSRPDGGAPNMKASWKTRSCSSSSAGRGRSGRRSGGTRSPCRPPPRGDGVDRDPLGAALGQHQARRLEDADPIGGRVGALAALPAIGSFVACPPPKLTRLLSRPRCGGDLPARHLPDQRATSVPYSSTARIRLSCGRAPIPYLSRSESPRGCRGSWRSCGDGLRRADEDARPGRFRARTTPGSRREAAFDRDAAHHLRVVRPEFVARFAVGLGDVPGGVDADRSRRLLQSLQLRR